MMKILDFVKGNWLTLLLALAVIWLSGRSGVMPYTSTGVGFATMDRVGVGEVASPKMMAIAPDFGPEATPIQSADRMVVQDTYLSMLVKDVKAGLIGIEKIAVEAKGYMVNRSMNQPEGASTGSISLRVPSESREKVLEQVHALGVKVTSETVSGYDVTDQYTDLESRLGSLLMTKEKIASLLARAERVSDLMEIQMQLTNIEQQIDSVKGQQKYLEQTAKLTKITVNLATDELSLPYTPDSAWRPMVVVKEAVRSMLLSLRSVANAAIWLVIYSPIWASILLVIWLAKKIKK